MGFEINSARSTARDTGRKTFLADKPCVRGHFERFTATARCVRCTVKLAAVPVVRPKTIADEWRSKKPRNLLSQPRYGGIGISQSEYCNGPTGRATSRRLDDLIRRASGLKPAAVVAPPSPPPISQKGSNPGWESSVRVKSGHVHHERNRYWNA